MTNICAIFTHFANRRNTMTCLARLARQTHRLHRILLINNSVSDDPVLEEARSFASQHYAPNTLHILQMESNLGNAGGCAAGIDHAFRRLGADAVWVLDDDSWPRPQALQALLREKADPRTVRMSLVIDPRKNDDLSWPLTIVCNDGRWKNVITRRDLPEGNAIPSRGGWLGALYPRAAWEAAGIPTPELFIRGEDEEYPWKVRQAGFRFITVRDSELEHPSSPQALHHFRCGDRSFFYEAGLPVSRHYYKARNWAWLQRLKHPKGYIRRLAACAMYILLSINFMMQTEELTLQRLTALLRALHNGFYGKLRPY